MPFRFLAVFVASRLALRFPEETVVEYAPRLLGKFGGKLVGFIYTFYFFYGGYYVMRQFGELMATAYYPQTPIIVFIAVLGLLACYAVYLGLEVLCRVILIWGVFAPVFMVLLVLLVKDIEFNRFLPLLEFGLGPVVVGAIAPASWLSQMGVIVMLLPFVGDRRRVVRTSFTAVLAVFSLGEVVLITAIGVMGAETVSRLLFPAFTLFRRVHVTTLPVLDRLDAVFMTLWMGGDVFKPVHFLLRQDARLRAVAGTSQLPSPYIPGGGTFSSPLGSVLGRHNRTCGLLGPHFPLHGDLRQLSANELPPSISGGSEGSRG